MGPGKKGKGKGKGKARKDGEKRVPYSELSEEKKAEIKEKHETRAIEEGRELTDDNFHRGTLLKRGRFNGWIKPAQPGKLPQEVKTKLKEMTKTQKKRAVEKGTQASFDDGVIYVRMCDVEEGVKIEPGMSLMFKIYTDSEGVGAYEVQEA